MTNRDRFLAVLNFKKPLDRLPVIEWASWWDKTLARWAAEGLDPGLSGDALFRHFDLDVHRQYWLQCLDERCPGPAGHGAPLIRSAQEYQALKPLLYPERRIDPMLAALRAGKAEHDRGGVVIWLSVEGAFWFPRVLLGIQNHFLSFYDEPELYRQITGDLADFEVRQMEKVFEICTPEFLTIAEDMSYNKGPMLSEACFQEFLAPYYRRVVPFVRERGTKVFVDTDGDVTKLVPWLTGLGVQGILPLERMAGVDVAKIRADHPGLLLMGAFDKTVMKRGEAAMRAEFDRLLPVMRQGGFIPGVDHQTPPDVSMANYRTYVRLLLEYAREAVR